MTTRAGAATTGTGSHCGFCHSDFSDFREHLLAAHPACHQCSGTIRFKDRQALDFHKQACHSTNTGKKGMKPKAHTQPASQPGGSGPASKKGTSKSTSATSMNPRPVGGVAIAQAHQPVQGGIRPGGTQGSTIQYSNMHMGGGFPRQPQGTASNSAGRGAGGASRGKLAFPQHPQHRQIQGSQPPQSSFVPRSSRLPQRPNAGVLFGAAAGAAPRELRGRELDLDDDDDDDESDEDENEDEDEDDDDDSESDTDSSESGENDNDDSSTASSSDSHDLTTWDLNNAPVDGEEAQNYPNLHVSGNPSGHIHPVPTGVHGNTPTSYGARAHPNTVFLPPQVEMLQGQVSLPATTEAPAPLPAFDGPPPNAPRGPRGQAPAVNAGGKTFVCRDCNSRAFRSCGGLSMHVLHKHKLHIGRKTRNIAKQKGMAKAGEGVWVDGRWISLSKATRKQLRRGRWNSRWKKKLTPEQKKRNEEKRKRRSLKKKRKTERRKQKRAEKKRAAEAEKLRAAELAASGALIASAASVVVEAESQVQEDMVKATEGLKLS